MSYKERKKRRPDGCIYSPEAVVEGIRLVNSGIDWHSAAHNVGMSIDNLKRRALLQGISFRKGYRSFRSSVRLNLPEKPTDLAYLAALLDGEGYITIAASPRSAVRVGITNTDIGIMNWLKSIGGGVCLHGTALKKQCYNWQLYSRLDTRAFLEAVIPYMRMKNEKAAKAIEILSRWISAHEIYRSESGGTRYAARV